MRIKLTALLCIYLPFTVFAKLPVNSFDNLMAHVCVDTDIAAAAKMQVDVARQRVETSKLDTWMPAVTLGLDVYAAKGQPTSFFAVQGGEVQDPAEPNFYQQGEAWQGKVDINWALYEEGKWLGQSGLKQSESLSGFDIAKAQMITAYREALKLIGQYYFNALMYSAQIDALQPLVEKRKQQLDSMNTKIEAGINTKDDFYTANSAYISLHQQWVVAVRQLEINLGFLQIMTKIDFDILNVKNGQGLTELASIMDHNFNLGDLHELVNKHPDVNILEAKLALENNKLEAQRGKLKPNLNLYIKLRTADNFDNPLRKDYGEVGLTFEYPLGTVPSNYGESKALQKSITAIGIELHYLKKIKMLQAANIAGDLVSAKGKITVALLDLQRREQILQSELQKVNTGLSGLDDLVKSEDDKINAQMSLLSSYNQAWGQYMEASLFTDSICSVKRY